MSISSSLWEVRRSGGDLSFGSLFRAGVNIGKDTLGTMLNTLILAYIGSSLTLILLLSTCHTTLAELFNMELLVVEILRSLVGSLGMPLTMPLTAAACGWLYTARSRVYP